MYRNLFNPQFYLLAYQHIYVNHGSMTPGIDGTTMDGMGMERINSIIEKLRDHSYQPTPVRRQYIPKKNGKKRPLGIPSTDDKLVQEVVHMILESIYEPTFHHQSHGFRPGRSCHTALSQIQRTYPDLRIFLDPRVHAKMTLASSGKVWLGSANMAMSNSLDSTIGIESPAVYAYFMDQIRRSGLLCPENELQLGFDDPVYDGKPVCAAEDFDELDDDE